MPRWCLREVFCRVTRYTHTHARARARAISLSLSLIIITDTLTYIYNLCIDKHYVPKAFKLLTHFKANQLLHPNQSGLREHHSCHTVLTTLVDKWHTNINNEFSAFLFVDVAKAFDEIDHNILLRKLLLYGLSNDTLRLVTSFLSNAVASLCKQGSVLGPLLISLYIHDLPLFIRALC